MAPSIEKNLAVVRERMAEAAYRSGREPGAVTLVAVTKRQSAERVLEAYDAGCREFGENYVQELCEKAAQVGPRQGLRWHHIGQLQTNKARQALELAALVHGVDRESVAVALAKRAAEVGRVLPILVQVNVARESQKGGCDPVVLGALLDRCAALPSVRVVGLMTMPPFSEEPEDSRRYFRELHELRERFGGPARLPELSMGMSHDFAVAIAEGATLVRIGTAIFGERA